MRTPPYRPPSRSISAAETAAIEWRRERDQRTPLPLVAQRDVSHTKPIPIAMPASQPTAPTVALVKGSTISPEAINWLWPGWLAAGKMHVLGGAPGTGKTTIALAFAATVSTGGCWPDGTRATSKNTIIWSGEDDPKDTLAPRLIAAGADMARCFFVGDVLDGGKSRAFDPAKDISPLADAIRKAGGASLIIVDPIVSAVAGDSHKNAETRRSLQPLVDLAVSVGAALVGVTHFSKGTAGRDPTERITGSLAFGALARVVLVAAKVPGEDEDEPPKRVLMRAKSNIGSDEGGFEYGLRQVDLNGYSGLSASMVEWIAPIEGVARDVLQEGEGKTGDRDSGAVTAAAAFLRALLASGPMAASAAEAEATGSGLSIASLRRAKKVLGVIVQRKGFGPGSECFWSLPDH